MAARKTSQADSELVAKYAFWEKVIDAGKIPFWLAASWVPLQPISGMVDALAGRDTNVNFVATASIAWGAVTSAGWAQSAARSRGRQKRLEAGRVRTDSLEGRLINHPLEERRA